MAGDEDETDSDADRSSAGGLEALLDVAAIVIEDAHEIGVAAVSTDRSAQLARAAALREAGADLVALANACEVLIRRQNGE